MPGKEQTFSSTAPSQVTEERQNQIKSTKASNNSNVIRSTAILSFEESVHRNPYNVEAWLSYVSHQTTDPPTSAVFCIYERAVAALPGSYKLWRRYALAFQKYSLTQHPLHPSREAALSVTRRAADALRVSPVLWTLHIQHIIDEGRWTRLIDVVDIAIKALPVTQHQTIWDVIIPALEVGHAPSRMALKLLRRYAIIKPGAGREQLIQFLIHAKIWDDASVLLCQCLSDLQWQPKEATREEYWLKLASIVARYPNSVPSVDVPMLLRGAAKKAVIDAGELWVSLAEYFIRKGMFEDARSAYEEAMKEINKVRDFALIFEAYSKFEERLVQASMEDMETLKQQIDKGNDDIILKEELKDAEQLVELYLARLEYLTNRRSMLLSDVCLKQNPHNVHEWHKRARMYKDANDPPHVVDTYTKAVRTVDPWRAKEGRPHTLWLAFANYYEKANDIESARKVIEKAIEDPENFSRAEDLASVWCEYAEMELRSTSVEKAREVLKRAIKPRKKPRDKKNGKKPRSNAESIVGVGQGAGDAIIRYEHDNSSPAWNVHRSRRIWSFLLDLTQSVCAADEVISIHDDMLQEKLATVETILNGATYLESQKLFEEAFRLYDKGATALPWPDALQIWIVYLTKFMKRFRGRKMERLRNLFEEAIQSTPKIKKGGKLIPYEELKLLFILYATAEQKYSLPRHALKIYARAVKEVRDEDKADMYRLYILKISNLYGITKTRPVYEQALLNLHFAEDVLEFGIRFAEMEKRIGEYSRVRAIYMQTCAIADTRATGIFKLFWKSWNDFELEHGNEDTFKDMLREKKNVQLNHKGLLLDKATLEQVQYNSLKDMVKDNGDEDDDKQETEQTENGNRNENRNEEEIDIDLTDSDDEDQTVDEGKDTPSKEDDGKHKETNDAPSQLPAALQMLKAAAVVYHEKQSGAKRTRAEDEEIPMGALERFKKRK